MKTLEREEGTQTAHRENFQPADVLKQVVISTLAVAPDGESIVYVKRTVEDGKYARRLWRTTFDKPNPEQLTSAKASDMRPRFSPDGKQLLFISDRTGRPQAWIMSLTGGEPKQITDLPSGVGAADWSPDGKKLMLLAGSGEKRFIIGKEDDPTARRIRDYTWRMDGVGVRDEFTSVWITDVDNGKPARITAPTYNVEAAAWSPDGKHIAFLADLSDGAGLEELSSVWSIPVEGGDPKQVAKLGGAVANLAWAPSRHIAFLGLSDPQLPGWADVELHVAEGKEQSRLAADRNLTIQVTSYGDFQDVENFGPPPLLWEDDQNVISLVSHHGRSHPYRFGIDGKVEQLAKTDAICNAIAAGGGRIAVVASTDEPSDVYAVENGKLRRLGDDGSKWYGPFNRAAEHHQIKHKDGHEIETWLLKANGKKTRAPLVIDVHGGPHSSFGPTPWLEMNALSDAGFHVVWSNPRGSVSYGEKYARDLEGKWGDPDGSDLLTIIDWAAQEGLADKKQIGIMGLSYGGFMTTWMLANHPGVFKAAVSENPVTDLLGEWATSDFGRFIGRRAIETQSPWENIDRFLTGSPFYKMHLNTAPLLLLQAENDMRCPPGNSEMVFHILRTLGREVEMIRYPAETHVMLAIGRPDRRVDRIQRIVDWFAKHMPPVP
ncbi:MAG TPA: S9 family peptidase [Candidatus Limnocylindrales bacterium]|nr:S9 family peptidase [Candidatus Limnocylindrales bacterium]